MELLNLYLSFVKIGFTSFGGTSMVPLIYQEVTNHGWLSPTQAVDIVAIAEMTPGPLGLNCATFAGIQAAGVGGAIAACLGVLTPTLTLCVVVAFFFEKFKNSVWMQRLLVGVRPASIGLVVGVVVTLMKSSYVVDGAISWPIVAIGAFAFAWLLWKRPTVPAVIGACAALGLLLVR